MLSYSKIIKLPKLSIDKDYSFTVSIFGDMGYLSSEQRPELIKRHEIQGNWTAIPSYDVTNLYFFYNLYVDMRVMSMGLPVSRVCCLCEAEPYWRVWLDTPLDLNHFMIHVFILHHSLDSLLGIFQRLTNAVKFFNASPCTKLTTQLGL